jgi:hypothetical protein
LTAFRSINQIPYGLEVHVEEVDTMFDLRDFIDRTGILQVEKALSVIGEGGVRWIAG